MKTDSVLYSDNDIEISEYSGEGYNRTMHFGEWRVAILNYAPRFDEALEASALYERHLLTDEVFVLLNGNATLVYGEDRKRIELEQGRLYNIKQGTWHSVFVSRDGKILIVENHNTGLENSEYKKR